jgi:hypothetical protein
MPQVKEWTLKMNAATQLLAGATQTASTNGAAANAGTLNGGGTWNPAGTLMLVTIPITTLKRSAGNETYAFKVQDSPDGSTWTDRSVNRLASDDGGPNTDGAAGTLVIPCNIKNPANVRLVSTLAGTSPSITFTAVALAPAFSFFIQAKAINQGGGWVSLQQQAASSELNETVLATAPGGCRNLDLTNLNAQAAALLPMGQLIFIGIAPTS